MSEDTKTAREVVEDVQGELINGLANLLYDGDGPLESDEQTNDRYAAWLERIWQGEPVRHHALGDAVKRISDAEADRDLLMAATWDVYCALGYDTDGDKRWHCSPEVAARTVVQCAKEAREFSEEVGDQCEEQRERAERAEAELAALRERVRHRAWAFDVPGKRAYAAGLRDLLDDDTTGAASGEGEK